MSIRKDHIDALGRVWQQIEVNEAILSSQKTRLKDIILRVIKRNGAVPRDAKAMRVVTGLILELQAIYPTEWVIDQKFTRQFLRACPRALGRKIFARIERYVLRPKAFEAISARPRATAFRLGELFTRAVTHHSLAPRVKVVRIKKAKTI